MSAFIIVLETPHFATPDESGAYEIAEVPTGDCTVVVRNLKTDWAATSELVVN